MPLPGRRRSPASIRWDREHRPLPGSSRREARRATWCCTRSAAARAESFPWVAARPPAHRAHLVAAAVADWAGLVRAAAAAIPTALDILDFDLPCSISYMFSFFEISQIALALSFLVARWAIFCAILPQAVR